MFVINSSEYSIKLKTVYLFYSYSAGFYAFFQKFRPFFMEMGFFAHPPHFLCCFRLRRTHQIGRPNVFLLALLSLSLPLSLPFVCRSVFSPLNPKSAHTTIKHLFANGFLENVLDGMVQCVARPWKTAIIIINKFRQFFVVQNFEAFDERIFYLFQKSKIFPYC